MATRKSSRNRVTVELDLETYQEFCALLPTAALRTEAIRSLILSLHRAVTTHGSAEMLRGIIRRDLNISVPDPE